MKEANAIPGCLRMAPPSSDREKLVPGSSVETMSGRVHAVLVAGFRRHTFIALCT